MAAAVVAGPNPVLPIPPTNVTESVMVSNTVLSSDLFTPCQEPRVTLPTIGEQQQALQPMGGRLWGGNLAEYGGIGGLSHLGIHRVKDLLVSRSHRHYQSGLTKHDGDTQPCRRTQLKLSECRVNDESLTAPLQTDPTMIDWAVHNPSSWPGFHAYTSHRPRFEVFPTGGDDKPLVTAAQSVPGTRMPQPLGETTKTAISEINRKLYQRTSYQDSFPDFTHDSLLLPSRLKKLGVIPLPNTEYDDAMYYPVIADKTDSATTDRTLKTHELENEEVQDKNKSGNDDEEEDSETDDEKDDVEQADIKLKTVPETPPPRASRSETESDSSQQKSRSPSKSVSFVETPQVMEDTIRKFDIIPNKPMTGVGPNWPPSTSQVINSINGSQLLERNDITQYPPAYRSALKQVTSPTKGHQMPRPHTPTKERKCRTKRPHTPVKTRKCTKTTMVAKTASQWTPPPAPPLPPPLTRQCTKTSIIAANTASQRTPPPALPLPPPLTGHELAAKRSAPLQPLTTSQRALAILSQYDEHGEDVYGELNLPDSPNQPFVVPHSYRQPMIRKPASSLPALKKTRSKVFNWIGTTKRPLPLPPAPLSDCLALAGNRTPHRLGLRYKSEAHKRYHCVHPESVPELSNGRIRSGGKRYFFYDNHASVYRG